MGTSASLLLTALIAIVAAEHLYFLYLEMFAWSAERTRRIFGTTREFAEASKTLAANQGLYNGFLACGLLFSLFFKPEGATIARLFLGFVLAAALYGGVTVNRRILLVQGLPAALAMFALLFHT